MHCRNNSKKFILCVVIIMFSLLGITMANPVLTSGTWVNINPSGLTFGGGGASLTQGMTIDPSNPSTLYVTICLGSAEGLYRSTDGGLSWARLVAGVCQNIRVDPNNSQHLYMPRGVNSPNSGFWVSTDGGVNWTMPKGFSDTCADPRIRTTDAYHVDVDPSDFNHLLVSFHSGWTDAGTGYNCGVLESKDGGITWIPHFPVTGMSGPGFNVFFLYNPGLGIGDKNTWLIGCQGGGYWRTTDAGASWKKVSDVSMEHGGGQIYYTKNKVLYVSGTPGNLRSTDNGATFTQFGPSGGYLSITGDGTNLYTGSHGGGHFLTAKENNDQVWTDFNAQTFLEGPFEMVLDPVNRIMYSANITGGVWALKLPAASTSTRLYAKPECINHVTAGTVRKLVQNRLVLLTGKSSGGALTRVYDINGRSLNTIRHVW
jgi:hypothetical protein